MSPGDCAERVARARARHPWPETPAKARALQERLRGELLLHPDPAAEPRLVAGVDVGFEDGGATTRAAVVLLDAETLEPCEWYIARRPTDFPYVPGLLSFREVPAILEAFAGLSRCPDLLLCDGQGLAHPRRFGLACHLGLLLDLPAVGVAKSRLIGEHGPVPDERGAWTPLSDGGEVIGAVLRTRPGVRPVFVSPGHRIDLETAIDRVMRCTTRYRLPETTRWADGLASRRPGFLARLARTRR